MSKKIINLELNRVEGDLELRVELENNIVTDAWCVGTMYRGFEQILLERSPRDSLVITPRVCGICGTAHLYTAVTALEMAYQCKVASNGTRIRNICLMSEEIQSDSRHSFLMFAIDFCNPKYAKSKYYPQILEMFEPMKGRIYKETIINTKKILEIVSIFGGQWPHSSYMVPGGVTTPRNKRRILEALTVVDAYTRWYETSILGCSLDRWLSVQNMLDFQNWLNEKKEHSQSAVGLFTKFGRTNDLHKIGKGKGDLLSYGSYFDPKLWQPPYKNRTCYRSSGFYNSTNNQIELFSQENISEHVKYSWFQDYVGGRHPFLGETIPNYIEGSSKYSWAKAPRYLDKAVEVGPISELIIAGDPLITSFFTKEGSNAWLRQFCRMHRPALSLQLLRKELQELLANSDDVNCISPSEVTSGEGFGLLHAARGALGHWIKIKDGKIEKYQIISPTSWNASPRDSLDNRGHWESSLIGTQIEDLENPVELGHIIRSHDACLVCAVHILDTGKKLVFPI